MDGNAAVSRALRARMLRRYWEHLKALPAPDRSTDENTRLIKLNAFDNLDTMLDALIGTDKGTAKEEKWMPNWEKNSASLTSQLTWVKKWYEEVRKAGKAKKPSPQKEASSSSKAKRATGGVFSNAVVTVSQDAGSQGHTAEPLPPVATSVSRPASPASFQVSDGSALNDAVETEAHLTDGGPAEASVKQLEPEHASASANEPINDATTPEPASRPAAQPTVQPSALNAVHLAAALHDAAAAAGARRTAQAAAMTATRPSTQLAADTAAKIAAEPTVHQRIPGTSASAAATAVTQPGLHTAAQPAIRTSSSRAARQALQYTAQPFVEGPAPTASQVAIPGHGRAPTEMPLRPTVTTRCHPPAGGRRGNGGDQVGAQQQAGAEVPLDFLRFLRAEHERKKQARGGSVARDLAVTVATANPSSTATATYAGINNPRESVQDWLNATEATGEDTVEEWLKGK